MNDNKMNEKKKGLLIVVAYGVAFLMLFFVLYKTPLRLDDMTWSGRIGMERLQSHFADYNGRYLGNLAVMALTRLPAFLRALIETASVGCFIYIIYRLLDNNKLATAFFGLLFAAMPLVISSQTVFWTAGFSNYFFSMMTVMTVLTIDIKVIFREKSVSPGEMIAILVLAFAGQFFVETASLYMIILSLASLVAGMIRKKKVIPLFVAQTAVTVAGALIMFTNGAYLSAFVHNGDSYKSIETSGMIITAMKAYRDGVGRMWFGMNTLLNFILVIAIITMCIRSKKRGSIAMACIGTLFLGLFTYDVVDGDLKSMLTPEFTAVISVLFFIYVFLAAGFYVEDKRKANEIICLLLSLLVLMLPLTLVTPISERCLLNTYALWAVITVELGIIAIRGLRINISSEESGILLLSGIALAAYLCAAAYGMSISWEVQEARLKAIEECKNTNAKELEIPRIPNERAYCYGASADDEYWRDNFKEFYGIDEDVELKFINYNE